tara:strand:- start:229 stop:465 length:237 start_codon:yes stop_codon:yes gene_type:complete
MENLEKYNEAFKSSFEIKDEVLKTLEYQAISNWDSVGHMVLIACLEETFDIMLEMEDVIDFSSYLKGKEILKKYSVEI